MECLANDSPPWAAYYAFILGRLIALDKQPGVCPVVVVETWRYLYSNIFLNVTVSEATMACQDDHMCDGLKLEI